MDTHDFLHNHAPMLRMTCSSATRVTTPWVGDRYRVRLHLHERTHSLIYHKGVGHRGSPPSLDEVLLSLSAECAAVEDARSFEQWADHYGYDDDSRRAESIYRECVATHRALRKFFGADVFEAFLTLEEA